MHARPELPLYIDSTMITCARSCLKKFENEFLHGLRPPGISVDLHAGACFATGLETTYRGIWEKNLSMKDALEYGHAAFSLAWGDYEIPEFKRTSKTFDRTWQAISNPLGDSQNKGYFDVYDPSMDHIRPYIAADGKATFEYTFAIPLEPAIAPRYDTHFDAGYVPDGLMGSPLDHDNFPLHPSGEPFLYSGRFDMLGSLNGRPVVRDEKTTGRSIGVNWAEQWDLRSQFIGYTWACQQGGLDVDTVVVRGIAILKEKIVHAEATKTYSDDLRARWLEQLRRDLWKIRRAYDEGYFDYDFADACTAYGNCIFLTACGAPVEQQESWLSQFEVRHWNPLIKNPIKEAAL